MSDTLNETVTYPSLTRSEFEAGCPHAYHGVRLCDDENGEYVYAYGHVDTSTFAAAVNDFDRDNGADADSQYAADDIEHRWAVATQPADGPDGWWMQWGPIDNEPVTAATVNAFAITVASR